MTPELQLIQGGAQARPTLALVPPTGRVRLGMRKYLRLKRSQDIVETLAWATVVAVVAMFLADGAIAKITDWASGLNALSRLTALVGTDLLLIHMLLIARVPWIDKLYGHDRATIAHKKLGKPILYLVIAHFAASLAQFAILDSKNVVDEFFSLITLTNDLLLSFFSLALMIFVVISSIKIARKKLSYEAWYIIHLTSYASVLLAIPHQFSTGSDIAGKPLQTAFWLVLYLFVALNLVWYRFLAPFVHSYRYGLRVGSVVRESSDTSSIYVTGERLTRLGGKAGQFYLLRVMTPKQWWRPHPFSISAAPNDSYVRFSVGVRGDDTAQLQHLKPGTRIVLEGPYGVFTEDRRTREKVVLIAAGIGAPPIRALAESLAARPGDVTIIYRCRNAEDAPLMSELQEIARRRGFQLHVLAGGRAHGQSWMPAHLADIPDHARLSNMAPWISESDVYICGPGAWTKTVERSLERAGTPKNQIHAEEFAW
ncbi:MAG: hypothetical protein RLZ71_604 [Actinomycetota bacterium]